MKSPGSKYLVYTSAGDKANLYYWLKKNKGQKCYKNFDLWVTYYGDQKKDHYRDVSDFYNRRNGGKFPK